MLRLLSLLAFLGAVETFDYPELIPPDPGKEVPDPLVKLSPKPYGLYSNDFALKLDRDQPESPALNRFLQEMRLRQYFREPNSLFYYEFFKWDREKRNLWADVNRAAVGKGNQVTINGDGFAVNLDNIETQMRLFGNQSLSLRLGSSTYLSYLDPLAAAKNQYRYLTPTFDTNARQAPRNMPFADSSLIANGLSADQNLILSLRGTIARKVEVEINHDTRSRQNTYRVEYKGDENEFISSVKLGNVSLNNNGKSQFVFKSGSSKEAFGIRLEAGVPEAKLQSVVSFTRGVTERRQFNIGDAVLLKDIQYAGQRFYQLPDREIKETHLFQAVLGDATNTAGFALDFTDLGSNSTRVYFTEVDATRYKILSKEGILDTQRILSGSTWSVLFYNWGVDQVATSTNDQYFTRNWTIRNAVFDTNRNVYKGFAVIQAPGVGVNDLPRSLELRNHYEVDKGLDPNSFRLAILSANGDLADPVEWIGTARANFTKFGGVELFATEGYFRFDAAKPFTLDASANGGMYDALVPLEGHHRVKMRVSYRSPFQNYVDLQRFNVIASSVVVIRNGRVIPESDYSVNPYTGRVTFSANQPLLLGDRVEVTYEYQPFGSSLQRVLLANRFDYTIRGDSYVGASLALSAGQASLTAPRLGSETPAQVVGDVDASLDLVSLLARQKENEWSLRLGGEIAASIYDRNVNGRAIAEDFESSDSTFTLPENFLNWYFTANPRLDDVENRRLGTAPFIDFNMYGRGGSRTAVPFTEQDEQSMRQNGANTIFNYRQDVNFRPFSVRPGPYRVFGEGHLNRSTFPEQSSLVFDYDFRAAHASSNLGYVSFLAPVGFGGFSRDVTRDFSRFNRVEITYKLVPWVDEGGQVKDLTNSIGLSLDAGILSEDLDRNGGIPQQERSAADVTGFPFAYVKGASNLFTRIGAGWRGWTSTDSLEEGNGILDTEDFNGNGRLDTNELFVTYPGVDTTVGNVTNFFLLRNSFFSPSALESVWETNAGARTVAMGSDTTGGTNALQREEYRLLVVPLRNVFTNDLMTKVRYVRLNLLEISNTSERGRLVIDSVQFKGNSWDRVLLDGFVPQGVNQFNVNSLNSLNDDVYRRNGLARAFRNVYEDIWGGLQASEYDRLSETALGLSYNLNGTASASASDAVNGRLALVEKVAPEGARDLSRYRELRLFTLVERRSGDGNEQLVFRFGPDSANYYEMRLPLRKLGDGIGTSAGKWSEVTIRFRGRTPEETAAIVKQRGGNVFQVLTRTSEALSRGNRNVAEPVALDPSDYLVQKVGSPSLYRYFYTALGMVNPSSDLARSGSVWVNDIYANDDELQIGMSYRLSLSLAKRNPILIGEREILSGLRADVGMRTEGLDFSSLDLPGNTQRGDSVNASFGFTLFRTLQVGWEGLRNYYATQYDKDLLPVENQGYGENSVSRLNLGLVWPKPLDEWIPNLRHSVAKNRGRTIGFDSLSTTNTNAARSLAARDQQSFVKSYNVSEDRTWNIGRNVRIGQSYSITADYSRNLTLRTNLPSGSVTVFDPKQAGWFPAEALLGIASSNRSPILSFFPEENDSLTRKKDLLQAADWTFRRSQDVRLDIGIFDFKLSGGVTWGESTVVNITNATDDLTNIQRFFEPETYYADWGWSYLPEVAGLWQNPELPGRSRWTGKDRNYNLSLEWNRPLGPAVFPILSRIGLTGSFGQTESDFRTASRGFVASDFFTNHFRSYDPSKWGRLSSLAGSVQDFFASQVASRDIANTYSLSLNLPFAFGEILPITSLPISLSRRMSWIENDTLDVDPDNDGPWPAVKREFPELLGAFGKGDRQAEYLKRGAPVLFGVAPWMDFWWAGEVILAVADLFTPDPVARAARRRALMDAPRIERARLLDATVDSFRRPALAGGSAFGAFLSSHADQTASVTLGESWNMSVNLIRNPVLDYFLPVSVSLDGDISTTKTGPLLRQNVNRRFRTSKDFEKIMRLVNERVLPAGDGFRRSIGLEANYGWEENIDYFLKTQRDAHSFGLRTSLRLFRDLTIDITWDLQAVMARQSYRYLTTNASGQAVTSPFLGIGDWVPMSFADASASSTLNIGSFEATNNLRKPSDFGAETPDLDTYQHGLSFTFRWSDPKPFVIKLFGKELKLPPNANQAVGVNLSIYDYQLSGVDAGRFLVGRFLPDQQPDPIAAKNLRTFVDPNGNREFTVWSAKTGYNTSFQFGQNFSVGAGLTLAVLGRAQARSYAAWKKIARTTLNADGFDAVGGDSRIMRDIDYVQAGLDFNLSGSIRF